MHQYFYFQRVQKVIEIYLMIRYRETRGTIFHKDKYKTTYDRTVLFSTRHSAISNKFMQTNAVLCLIIDECDNSRNFSCGN